VHLVFGSSKRLVGLVVDRKSREMPPLRKTFLAKCREELVIYKA